MCGLCKAGGLGWVRCYDLELSRLDRCLRYLGGHCAKYIRVLVPREFVREEMGEEEQWQWKSGRYSSVVRW